MGAIVLVNEYSDDLYWASEKIVGELERQRIIRELEQFNLLSTVHALGTKQGKTQYYRWRRKKLAKLEDIEEMMVVSELNVFQRLQRQQKNRTRTVFDNLIQQKRK